MMTTLTLLLVLQADAIRWETSLDAARARAAREGKPVLFHQLVGDLDKEGC
jgi:hypothetical protein